MTMTENDIDRNLSSQVKACVAEIQLPDGFAERLRLSVHRSQRMFRIRILAVTAVAAATAVLAVVLMARTEPHGDRGASIVATHGNRGDERVSGWMLLSVFRDLFRRNRTSKRKEDE